MTNRMTMIDYLKNNPFFTGLLLAIIVFVGVKIPFLSLPYYWDEAWVYGPAIRTMEATKLGILPDALPPELSRGHPLLFHFLGAAWMTAFGTSTTVGHIFPLFLSVLLFVAVYLFGKKIFLSDKAGFTAAFVLALQPIFLAQSGLLLPEVMLALFSLITFYFYLDNKRILYVLAGILTLFTKESGLTVIATLLLWTLLEALFSSDGKKWKKFFVNSVIISLPLIPFIAYFVYQNMIQGWFFFPEHIGLIASTPEKILNQLERYAAYVFIYQGRNLLTFSTIIALLVVPFSGRTLEQNESKAVLVLLLHCFVYLIFSSLNFYSDRYTMMLIPMLSLLFAFCINKAFDFNWVPWVVLVVVAGLQWQEINKRTNSDHNLGYADAIETHEKAIAYCEEKELKDKIFYGYFLMERYMENPYSGYVTEDDKFTDVSGVFNDKTEYAIFSNVEDKENYEFLKTTKRLKLLERFEERNAWTEVYKVEK